MFWGGAFTSLTLCVQMSKQSYCVIGNILQIHFLYNREIASLVRKDLLVAFQSIYNEFFRSMCRYSFFRSF